MEKIYALLRKYPNRIKYGLMLLSGFAMIFAIRTYINYIAIEEAIEHAIIQKQIKTDELYFTKYFLISYEESDYASYFLQHENNMLLRNEFIIKFEELSQKQETQTGTIPSYTDFEITTSISNQEWWKKFILEKFKR